MESLRKPMWWFALMLILAACSAATATEIEGIWRLESFTVDGSIQAVARGTNTRTTPWVEFADGQANGDGGCNTFGTLESESYIVDDGILVPGEIFATLAGCLGESDTDLNAAEAAFLGVLGERDGQIHVEVEGNTMTFRAGGEVLKFSRIETPPPPPTLAPQLSEGRLDCSPSAVVRSDVPDTGQRPEQVLRDIAPDVVEVVEDADNPPWWWGYDADGEVVAGTAIGDITPPVYHSYTCP